MNTLSRTPLPLPTTTLTPTRMMLYIVACMIFLICSQNIVIHNHFHELESMYENTNTYIDADTGIDIDIGTFSSIDSYIDKSNDNNNNYDVKNNSGNNNGNGRNDIRNDKFDQQQQQQQVVSKNEYKYNEYNATTYKLLVQKSMIPSFISSSSNGSDIGGSDVDVNVDANVNVNIVPTGAWIYGFWAGFCNQYFTFLGIVFLSNDLPSSSSNSNMNTSMNTGMITGINHDHRDHQSNQIYIHSIQWKDLYGTDQKLRHEVLFDVLHWNTFYPKLPKLVSATSTSTSTSNSMSNSMSTSMFQDVYIHYDERGSDVSVVATNEKMDSKFGVAPRLIWNATHSSSSASTSTTTKTLSNKEKMQNATNPYPIGYGRSSQVALNQYKQFSKRLYHSSSNKNNNNDNGNHNGNQKEEEKQEQMKHEIEKEQYELIMKDAFRPHPELQHIIDEFKSSMNIHSAIGTSTSTSSSKSSSKAAPYMVLHARVEPDMQKHPVCKDKKVTNMTHIINALYDTYPKNQNPPTRTLILLLNKELLEEEVGKMSIQNDTTTTTNNNNKLNTMAEYNLQIINDILQNGLWDGQVNVIEAGSKLVSQSNHEIYSKYPVVIGGIVNFFLSMDASIFIGTEVSSYSTSIVNSRFYRHNSDENGNDDGDDNTRIDGSGGEMEMKKNYFYVPNGLYLKDTPHWFRC